MRLGGTDSSADLDDIKLLARKIGKLLARKIGIASSKDALAIVEKFYPNNILEPKTRFGLEEIFSSLENGQSDERAASKL
jgi:hypothetical protein